MEWETTSCSVAVRVVSLHRVVPHPNASMASRRPATKHHARSQRNDIQRTASLMIPISIAINQPSENRCAIFRNGKGEKGKHQPGEKSENSTWFVNRVNATCPWERPIGQRF